MRETKAVEIPIIKDGKQKGIIQKYYKYGMWNYRAIIFRPNGIISGNFFTLENAKEFIKLSNEANNEK